MLLSEQHGREIIGDRGQAGTSFHLRRRISGGMRSLLPYVAASARTGEIIGNLPTCQTLTGQQWLRSTALRKKKKKSTKAAKSRKSAPDGKKMHKHGAGPRCFLNIEYKMMVDEGLDEPPSYTALARKTHTEMLQDGSPLGDCQTDSTAASNAKRYLLNQEYIKRGKTKKGTVYGLGSVQYKNSSASVPIPVSLKRNLDVDMRMSGFETTISEVKEDIAGVKEDFSALKTEINAFKTEVTGGMSASQPTLNIILQTLQSQASTNASTAQPFQLQAQSQPQGYSYFQK
ncbi:hypothetical protein Bca101_049823 [Brassica carinata]